ncbi:hypothetical protein PMI27_002201 [Pseudomonas sp. GM41(2012)]|nr:hypothetical protein PMI27_002201 [Pseudomonas sp. GM41(2012)]
MVYAKSLGYADNTRVENTLASEQVPVEGFVRFHSEVSQTLGDAYKSGQVIYPAPQSQDMDINLSVHPF